MSICYFDNDNNTTIRCDYRIEGDQIYIDTEFDINNEIEKQNGVAIYHSGTSFRDRDITIINSKDKEYIFIIGARYNGHGVRSGTLDSAFLTSFCSNEFIVTSNYEALLDVSCEKNTDSFRIYSTELLNVIGKKSLVMSNNDSHLKLELTKIPQEISLSVESNNIKEVSVSDYWKFHPIIPEVNYSLRFNGYITVKLESSIDIRDVFHYIYELIIYMQLYKPNKFELNRIELRIGEYYYEYHIPILEIKITNQYVDTSVKCGFLEFIKNCYLSIPYRNSTEDIRNIKYIILNKNRSIEDNFLTYFRFVECYYKKKTKKRSNYRIIADAISQYYKSKGIIISRKEIDKEADEITQLRNHYVHSGYYLRDGKLKIYKKVGTSDPVLEREVDADVSWIFDKTKLLYNTAVYIIFTKLLGYQQYKYK